MAGAEVLNGVQTMKLLRITRTTLAAMLASGQLRGFVRGKVIRVSRQSVEELLGGRLGVGSDRAGERRAAPAPAA